MRRVRADLGIHRRVVELRRGWGDPLQRDPVLIENDLREGLVTPQGAAGDYGHV